MTSSSASLLYSHFDGNLRRLLSCSKQLQTPVVVAHRGGLAPGFPENSMAALERVIAHAPVILEVDVVASADGVNFLHHDDTLDRTTTGTGPVSQKDWADISQLSLRDNAASITQFRPIRLSDMLNTIGGRAFLMLDLKAPADTRDVVRSVSAAGLLNGTAFIAYNHKQANEVLSVEPDALIALGASSIEQLEAAKSAGLLDNSVVALTGPISGDADVREFLVRSEHFSLAGSYFGQNPPDARLATQESIPEFDQAGKNGYQLIVSNRPLMAVDYLHQRGLQLEVAGCSSED